MNFLLNERADKLAKAAALGPSSPQNHLPKFLQTKPLPHSITRRWKASPRFSLIRTIDKSLPSNKFLKLIDPLDRRQSAILTQLHTSHAPLNHHLFRIQHSKSPSCPHCQGLTIETVTHYLLQCPHYQHECHILRCKLKCKADSLLFLLSNPLATKPLLNFIHTTKLFKTQPCHTHHLIGIRPIQPTPSQPTHHLRLTNILH